MSKLYRLLAIALLLIGLYVTVQAVSNTIADALTTYSLHPIKCDLRGCRTVKADGTLADDRVEKPKGAR